MSDDISDLLLPLTGDNEIARALFVKFNEEFYGKSLSSLSDITGQSSVSDAALLFLLRENAQLKANIKLLLATYYPRSLLGELMGGKDGTLVKYNNNLNVAKVPVVEPSVSAFRLLPQNAAAFGRGWYPFEQGANGGPGRRWTGPDRESYIILPSLMGGTYSCTLQGRFLDQARPFSVSIAVGGSAPITVQWHQRDGGGVRGEVSLEIGMREDSDALVLRLLVSEAVSPAEIGIGNDRRIMGFCFERLELRKTAS